MPSAADIWQSGLQARHDDICHEARRIQAESVSLGAHFGGRPLLNHFRPKFLTAHEERELRVAAGAVLSGIMAAKERILSDPKMLDFIGIRPKERELILIDPGYAHIAPCARLDSFMTPDGPRFVELNGECPAGPAYSDVLTQQFLVTSLMQELGRRMNVRAIATLPPLLATLLACYREWGGRRMPRIAVVDYDGLPTGPEFELCRDFFERCGYDTLVSDPRQLAYDGQNLLCAEGRRIDIVYRRVLTNEFLERLDEVRPLLDAYRDRAVCVVNPFCSKVVHKKAIFAVLTDDNRGAWLKPSDQDLIDRHVPWTRVVTAGPTSFAGGTHDLLELLSASREDFVLKPNDEYGGKGITLGWEVSDSEWQTALKDAVDNDFVVQQRLQLIPEDFPGIEGDLQQESLFVDLDPYLYRGQMVGALARLGAGGLCNVTSGGGQVPLIITGGRVD